jgi:3-deoxy-manno-octulosonate cytidylyltransferase (CMP-KDO synthetase)
VKSLKSFCEYDETALEKLEKLEQLRALSHGLTIGASIVDCSNSHGIDTHEDYLSVKKIMEKKL